MDKEKRNRNDIGIGALILVMLDQSRSPISKEMLLEFVNEYQHSHKLRLFTIEELSEGLSRKLDENKVRLIVDDKTRESCYTIADSLKGITGVASNVRENIEKHERG